MCIRVYPWFNCRFQVQSFRQTLAFQAFLHLRRALQTAEIAEIAEEEEEQEYPRIARIILKTAVKDD